MDEKEQEAARKLREWEESGKKPEATEPGQQFGELNVTAILEDPRAKRGPAGLLEAVQEQTGLAREAAASLAVYLVTRFVKATPGNEDAIEAGLRWLQEQAGTFTNKDIGAH